MWDAQKLLFVHFRRIKNKKSLETGPFQCCGSRSGIRDEQPGSYFLELTNNFFGVKILKFFDADTGSGIRDPGWRQFGSGIRDPRWKKVGSGIRDKHPGSATLVLSPGWRAGWSTLLCWFSFFYQAWPVADVETAGASVVHHLIYQKMIFVNEASIDTFVNQCILKIKSSKQGRYCALCWALILRLNIGLGSTLFSQAFVSEDLFSYIYKSLLLDEDIIILTACL